MILYKQILKKTLALSLAVFFLVVLQVLPAHAQIPPVVDARPVVQLPLVLSESSGLSVAGPNQLWSLNDAGNTNQLFCFDTTGVLLRSLLIVNASNVDWEDLATDDQGRIYINDAGNNQNDRRDLKIYRIPNPETIPDDVTNAEVINFMFEDQTAFPPPASELNFDIEAMVWKNDSLYLFTKNRSNPQSGLCKMYSLPAAPGFHAAKLRGSVFLGNSNAEARVTSATIHPQTGELLLLTSTKIVSFKNYPGNSFFEGEMSGHYFVNTIGQIEAIAFADNNRIFITEEGSGQDAGWLYEIRFDSVNAVFNPEAGYFQVYPNPMADELYFSTPGNEDWAVEIYDGNGKLMLRKTVHSERIDTSGFPAGLYFLHISSKRNYFVTKILKY
jgi:hypothetical protein